MVVRLAASARPHADVAPHKPTQNLRVYTSRVLVRCLAARAMAASLLNSAAFQARARAFTARPSGSARTRSASTITSHAGVRIL